MGNSLLWKVSYTYSWTQGKEPTMGSLAPLIFLLLIPGITLSVLDHDCLHVLP